MIMASKNYKKTHYETLKNEKQKCTIIKFSLIKNIVFQISNFKKTAVI